MDRTLGGSIHKGIAEEISEKGIPGVKILEGYRSGTVLITYEDFAYVVNIKKNQVIYLKCRIRTCNGSALITLKDDGDSYIQHMSDHLHPPDTEYINTVKFRCELRAKCKKRKIHPSRQSFNQVSSRQQKVTLKQQQILVSFMEQHSQLAYGMGKSQHSREISRILWNQLTKSLNRADGPSRPLDKWRKVWKSWRNKLGKQKELLEKQSLFRRKHRLTSLEERVLALRRPPRDSFDSTECSEHEMDERNNFNGTDRSFQELVDAVKIIDEAEGADECPSPNSDGKPEIVEDGETFTSGYYDGVQGEEIILEIPSDSFTVTETVIEDGEEREVTAWNKASDCPDLLSKLTGSMERMENTIRSMDESLKELINTVKMLVQFQQKEVQQ